LTAKSQRENILGKDSGDEKVPANAADIGAASAQDVTVNAMRARRFAISLLQHL
jgi:hypothetical protein